MNSPDLQRSDVRWLDPFESVDAIYHYNLAREVSSLHESLPGDVIGKATPVPIPNTVVKLSEPMIVLEGAKVGLARIICKGSRAHPREPLSLNDGKTWRLFWVSGTRDFGARV